jgi:methionyl-tRNA formyltransferase
VRLVFAGTPQPAAVALAAVLASAHQVAAVLTRPDAPSGRGRTVHPSAVAEMARAAGIEVLAPTSTRDPTLAARLAELAPDCCPVVAYGGLVPPSLLAVPPLGWVNLHFSLLPAWRGAAPVQHALMAGDEVSGATTFLLEEGLDTGPVLGVVTETVRPTDTAGDLLGRLASSGAALLVATLDGLERGALRPVPQPDEGVSLAPKLTVDDARVDWRAPALRVDRLVRACTPAPGAWSVWRGERVKIGPVRHDIARSGASALPAEDLPPGRLLLDRAEVRVGTGSSPVVLGSVQPAGRRAMPAADWVRGLRRSGDDRFEV